MLSKLTIKVTYLQFTYVEGLTEELHNLSIFMLKPVNTWMYQINVLQTYENYFELCKVYKA